MASRLDRREFLIRTGAIGAAGAVGASHWLAPAVSGANVAFASTSCQQQVDESALSGWTHTGSGSTSKLTKSYPAVAGKAALTVEFSTNTWNSSRTDSNNVSVQTGGYTYSGGTSPHILVKGTPDGGVSSTGVHGWIEVILTFSVGVTNLTFDIENIAKWGPYRRWQVWLSGSSNSTPPPAFTFTRNDSTTTGSGTQASNWTRDATSYGSVSVSMPGSNSTPITYLKFHFDMWRRWDDSFPAAMDAGIANLTFCR